MLKFFDNLFQHPSISTAFSGFATTLIQGITSKFHKHKSTNIENDTKPQSVEPKLSPIQKDILTIQKSIQSDLSCRQKEIYYRYLILI